MTLFENAPAALEYAGGFLRAWTSRNPLHSYKRDETTRRQVRKLLRKHEIADAIDAWMAAASRTRPLQFTNFVSSERVSP